MKSKIIILIISILIVTASIIIKNILIFASGIIFVIFSLYDIFHTDK